MILKDAKFNPFKSFPPFKASLESHNQEKTTPRFPLHWVLVVPFLIQVSTAVGLTGYVSLRNGQRAVNDLAQQLINKNNQLVKQHLDRYLSTPQRINQVNANLLREGVIGPRDFEILSQHFWRQAQIHPDISYIGWGLPNGEYVGAGDWYDDYPGIESDRTFEGGLNYTYSVDQDGHWKEVIDEWEYFPAQEEWYIKTAKAGTPQWILSFEDVADGDTYIAATANYPVFDADGQLVGVLGADLILTHVSDFLDQLNPGPDSSIFIVQQDGLLVAHSDPEQTFDLQGNQIRQRNIFDSPDPLMRTTASYLRQRFDALENIQDTQAISFVMEGDRHYIQATPWQDEFGLDWLVVVAVPESTFVAEINDNTRTTILLCLIALGVASIFGIYTSRWIARPILQINQASQAIATGHLDQHVQESNIQELSTLAQSFNQMARRLKDSFAQLEQTNETLEERVEERTQELTNAMQGLTQAQAKLVQSEKMSSLGQLVAGVAHEINNPINFIYGNLPYASEYTQDLLRLLHHYQQTYPNPSPKTKALIEEIELDFLQDDLPKLLASLQVGSERIQEILKSLRSFSRLDESEFKEADIHEGIDSTLMILNGRIKAQPNRKAIEIIKHYGNIPLVDCYPGQLNQVFMNILCNAIDALEETAYEQNGSGFSPSITITTRLADNQHVTLSIADNGPGISEQLQHRIFDPFFTTKPIGQGTGMGLSISYQIITENHRGSLVCVSVPGKGTEFHISIPLQQRNESKNDESDGELTHLQ